MIDTSIKIISINVNHSIPPTENALQIALERGTDIVLIQEPWFHSKHSEDWSKEQSIAHAEFTQILPRISQNQKPRTLAYISKNFTPSTYLAPSSPEDGDLQVIEISHDERTLQIINLYNQSKSRDEPIKTFQRSLKGMKLHSSSIIMGDFNSHHPWWNPRIEKASKDAEEIVEWIDEKELILLNKIGEETFFRGHTVIDLALISQPIGNRHFTFARDENLISDHNGAILEFYDPNKDMVDNPLLQARYNTKKADWPAFRKAVEVETAKSKISKLIDDAKTLKSEIHPLDQLRSNKGQNLQQKMDQLASTLTSIITTAGDATIPKTSKAARAKAWWSEVILHQRQEVARKRRNIRQGDPESTETFNEARNEYFRAIKDAKTEHWNQFLQKEDAKSIFKALKYTNGSKIQRMPPILNLQKVEQNTFKGKCAALKETLFQKPPEAETPQWDNYTTNSKWAWPTLSEGEIEHACSSNIQSKSPGPDLITQEIITNAYKAIPEIFLECYRIFIDAGYHPSCWREATGAVLPKPNKPKYNIPKAYRVITLLNSLGKISERILAQRLSFLAETTDLLDPTQIGGRAKKSAIDAALLLQNYIQSCKAAKRKVSTLFVDVKGAFDHVAHQRLLKILLDLKLPPNLITWVASFLQKRMLRIAFDGQIEDFSEVFSGVPQGSPISSILFLIYIRDLFKSDKVKWISYVDDISLSVWSTSIRNNVQILQREIKKLTDLANSSNIEFDLEKTDLMHWDQSKPAKKETLTLPNGKVVKPQAKIKWLGIFFDPNLKFNHHVKIKVAKARNTFMRVARLANLERGLSPHALRQLYIACVVSIADYGAVVWWRQQANYTAQLQSLQNLAIRKILGVFKTAPILPMEVECAVPPPEIRIQAAIRAYALRIHKLSRDHPINQTIDEILAVNDYDTPEGRETTYMPHLVTIYRSINGIIKQANVEKIQHFNFPPWERSIPYTVNISPLSKDEETKAHLSILKKSHNKEIYIYTDASSNATKDNKGIGIGIAVQNPPAKHIHKTITKNIGKTNLVYNGELEGATMAAEYAARIAKPGLEFKIFSDNQAGLWRLKTPSDNPGQENQIRAIAAAREANQKGAKVSYHWVPGHKDIEGNEAADKLAKAATTITSTSNQISYAMIGTQIKQKATAEWRDKLEKYDQKNPHKSRTSYRNFYPWKIRSKLIVPRGTARKTASAFYQMKLGHGRFRDYLWNRDHVQDRFCYCGEIERPEHLLLNCHLYSEQRNKLKEAINTKELALDLMLGTNICAQHTTTFLQETKIGTRRWLLEREEWSCFDEEEEEQVGREDQEEMALQCVFDLDQPTH